MKHKGGAALKGLILHRYADLYLLMFYPVQQNRNFAYLVEQKTL